MVGTILHGNQFIIKGLNGCERMSGALCSEFSYTFQSIENQGKNFHHEFWLISYRFLESKSREAWPSYIRYIGILFTQSSMKVKFNIKIHFFWNALVTEKTGGFM